MGQTFTAGHSGELKSVKLYLRNGGSASAGLTLDIKAVSGGQPSGASLLQAASVIPNSDVGSAGGGVQSVTVTFTTPPELVSGQEYAILVSTTDTNAYDMWHDSSNSDYSGGTAILSSNGGATWSNAGYDFSFETVMSWTE